MNVVDAFLLASGIAYICAALLPNPSTQYTKKLELPGFLILGALMILNVIILDFPLFWLLLGILSVLDCVVSYLGYIKWNVLWKEEPSDAAQMAMWAWDLAIAVCCFMKQVLI